MTYGNDLILELSQKLQKAELLLKEIQESFSQEGINEKFKIEFEAQKESWEESLKNFTLKQITIQTEDFKNTLKNEQDIKLENFYQNNKPEILEELSSKVSFKDIFRANADVLNSLNERNLKNILEQKLKENDYLAFFEAFKSDLESNRQSALKLTNQSISETKAEIKQELEDFKAGLSELDILKLTQNLLERNIKNDLENLSEKVLNLQKTTISTELLKKYTTTKEGVEILKEMLKNVLKDKLTERELSDKIEAWLLKENQKLLEQILKSKEMLNFDFKNNLVLSSLSLKNELATITEHLAILNDLKLKELRAKWLGNNGNNGNNGNGDETPDFEENLVLARKYKMI